MRENGPIYDRLNVYFGPEKDGYFGSRKNSYKMSWLNPRLAATQVNKLSKSVNPYMTAEKAESSISSEYQKSLSERKDSREDIHSISTIFGLDWIRKSSTEAKKLDQTLIENVRQLMEEERDRQIEFERMCRYHY
ncbi:hypothetical protein GCK32_000070 [Trichostrongylus colubriformis]|uniref:Uncharacterized protein n=1 Tax=Trichostrongylus colubriformis TaxID=6319 RepID=A0AAN8J2F8_TRICO